jgi:DNA polymerase elongation subunit (family B)
MGGGQLIGLDIETDTTVDGLDPELASVVAIATAEGTEVFDGDEPAVLRAADGFLGQLDAGVLVTWNGTGFDLPFLARRAELTGIPLGLRIDAGASWGRHRHLDAYRLYAADVRPALGISCSLKSVARFVGIPALEIDTSAVHTIERRALRAYVASDASTTRQLALRRWPAAAMWLDPLPTEPAVVDQAATSAVVPVSWQSATILPAST